MRRALLIAVLSLAAVLVAAPAGSGSSGSFSDARGDIIAQPVGVSSGSVDIVRATQGHSRGRLVHTVTTAGNVGNPARGTNFPLMFIERPGVANGTAECAYFIGRHNGRFGVFRCGYGSFVASVSIRRTSARTVRFEFSPRALGNPPSYQWAFRTRAATRDSHSMWLDRLPNGDKSFIRHDLPG
jgi:hypothetical protein